MNAQAHYFDVLVNNSFKSTIEFCDISGVDEALKQVSDKYFGMTACDIEVIEVVGDDIHKVYTANLQEFSWNISNN